MCTVKEAEPAVMEACAPAAYVVAEQEPDPNAPIPIERHERTWSHEQTGLRLELVGKATCPIWSPCGHLIDHFVIVRHESGTGRGTEIMSMGQLLAEYIHVDYVGARGEG